jgi:YafQ family addiction module toxin component
MPYFLDIRPSLDVRLGKLAKKNKKQYEIIMKKAEEVIKSPHRYKNLRAPLQHWKRVHIDKHFVLTFSIDENTKKVILEDFDHHDNIYKK